MPAAVGTLSTLELSTVASAIVVTPFPMAPCQPPSPTVACFAMATRASIVVVPTVLTCIRSIRLTVLRCQLRRLRLPRAAVPPPRHHRRQVLRCQPPPRLRPRLLVLLAP